MPRRDTVCIYDRRVDLGPPLRAAPKETVDLPDKPALAFQLGRLLSDRLALSRAQPASSARHRLPRLRANLVFFGLRAAGVRW